MAVKAESAAPASNTDIKTEPDVQDQHAELETWASLLQANSTSPDSRFPDSVSRNVSLFSAPRVQADRVSGNSLPTTPTPSTDLTPTVPCKHTLCSLTPRPVHPITRAPSPPLALQPPTSPDHGLVFRISFQFRSPSTLPRGKYVPPSSHILAPVASYDSLVFQFRHHANLGPDQKAPGGCCPAVRTPRRAPREVLSPGPSSAPDTSYSLAPDPILLTVPALVSRPSHSPHTLSPDPSPLSPPQQMLWNRAKGSDSPIAQPRYVRVYVYVILREV